MLDFDTVAQRHIQNGLAALPLEGGAIRTEYGMRKNESVLAYYTLLTFCPVSTLRMEASILRAANSPLTASAASMASLI